MVFLTNFLKYIKHIFYREASYRKPFVGCFLGVFFADVHFLSGASPGSDTGLLHKDIFYFCLAYIFMHPRSNKLEL
ncbi:MAG: hypothetical protein ATN35_12010 [Epulopiscium sp. Nele67-Bin004]|nr:MAG: hypothetical protein ATN35_12010 [Epulopiscium sp. Nele67-Bin004]